MADFEAADSLNAETVSVAGLGINLGRMNAPEVVSIGAAIEAQRSDAAERDRRQAAIAAAAGVELAEALDADKPIDYNVILDELKAVHGDHVFLSHSPELESLAFFNLFVSGEGGLLWNGRRVRVKPALYSRMLLMNRDDRFATCLEWILYQSSQLEQQRLLSQISFSFRLQNGRYTNAGQIRAAIQDGTLPYMIAESRATYLLRNQLGSPAYWKTKAAILRAGILKYGPPTWFLTLSFNDLHDDKLIAHIKQWDLASQPYSVAEIRKMRTSVCNCCSVHPD